MSDIWYEIRRLDGEVIYSTRYDFYPEDIKPVYEELKRLKERPLFLYRCGESEIDWEQFLNE